MSISSGAAREVAPGRLADFENAADDELGLDRTPSLPPRRRRVAAAPDAAAVTPEAAPRPRPAELAQPDTQPVPMPAPAQSPSGGPAAAEGIEDRARPSNVQIPVKLRDPVKAKCEAEGMSAGDVIIVAIEAAYPKLRELIRPAASAGGSVFASRRSHAPRTTSDARTPLNYRMRETDFKTLDRLVAEFDAKSRADLITAALTYYFHEHLT